MYINDEMTSEDLILNLKAAGFKRDMIERYLSSWKNGKTEEQFKLLSEKRESLLNCIHQKQKQIDCLDYLAYKIGKQSHTVTGQ